MVYFGVYHSDYARSAGGILDAPCITKGRMMLCARDVASEGGVIAMARGVMRNRTALAAELGCSPEASPAMVTLRAFRRWKEDFPRHIEGPVATCAMDADGDEMVLARDRMGERQVFYSCKNGSAAFADHPDALLKTARALPVLDADGVRELFGFGPARSPGYAYYRDMRSLEPGCALIVRDGTVRMDYYWRVPDCPHEDDAATTVARTRELLELCVEGAAALQPAFMLSGGLDSTALTALMKGRVEPQRTFSVNYLDDERDFRANAFRPERDAPYVREAVRAFGTQHRDVTLEPRGLAGSLDRAVSLRGFPGMADIDASLLLLSQEIARFDRHAVSGECGDEVFGGYPWFRGEAPLDGFPWSGSLPLRESLLLPELQGELHISEYVRDVFETRRAQADPGAQYAPKERRLRTMQRLCFEYFMPNLQERASRMGEGAGLRVLTPLCDDRLVRYVYNVPWDMKFMGGQEKGLLRAAVADLLPEKLLRRTKSPYPKTCSPQYGRLIREMALAMADDANAPLLTIVDRSRVRALADSMLDPAQAPWFGQLMAGPQLLGYLWQVNRWMLDRNIRIEV